MSTWYNHCKVNSAGPAADGGETAGGTVYVNLTDPAGAFTSYWFYAAVNAKPQMLAVVLTAITLGYTVSVNVDGINPNNSPFTQINRLYIDA
jgi:hypothetical protein